MDVVNKDRSKYTYRRTNIFWNLFQHFVDDVKEHERDLKAVNQSGEDFLHEAKVNKQNN